MGTWGHEILEDDEVLDVVNAFFHAYDHGASPAEATRVVREMAGPRDGDPAKAEHTRFWLGLAHAQWECKALEPETLAAVEHIVRNDVDRARWERGWSSRRKVLVSFLAALKKPKARARRRQPAKLVTPPFATGSVLAFPVEPSGFGTAIVLATSGDDRPVEYAKALVAFTSAEGAKPPTVRDVLAASTSPKRMALLTTRGKDLKAQAALLARIRVVGNVDVRALFDTSYGGQGDWDLGPNLVRRKAYAGGPLDEPVVPVAEVVAGPTNPTTRELAELFTEGLFCESTHPATRHREGHERRVRFLERCLALGVLQRGDTIDQALARPAWVAFEKEFGRALVRSEACPYRFIASPVRRWHQGHFAALIAPP